MSVIRRIFIPPDVTADHRTVVQRHVERIGELSGSEWPLVVELKSSAIWSGLGCVSRLTIYLTRPPADHLTTCSYPVFGAM